MKKLSFILAVILLFTTFALAEDVTEFEPSEKLQRSQMYTAIMLDNYDFPIYAYEHESGETAFRVYGSLNRKKGFYEAELTKDGDQLKLNIIGEKPRTDKRDSAAIPNPGRRGTFPIPEDWTYFYDNNNYLQFEDFFGKMNTFVAVSYRKGQTEIVPCNKKGEPIPGSLGVNPYSYDVAIKQKPCNYVKPRQLKNGYQVEVYVTTSDGERVAVKTYNPELNVDELEISNKLPRMRVRIGTESADVKALQRMLTELGYYAGDIDGIFGEGCIHAIELFQKENGLKVNGKIDERFMRTLIFGDPVQNPNEVDKEDFKSNNTGVGGDSYKDSYLP